MVYIVSENMEGARSHHLCLQMRIVPFFFIGIGTEHTHMDTEKRYNIILRCVNNIKCWIYRVAWQNNALMVLLLVAVAFCSSLAAPAEPSQEHFQVHPFLHFANMSLMKLLENTEQYGMAL